MKPRTLLAVSVLFGLGAACSSGGRAPLRDGAVEAGVQGSGGTGSPTSAGSGGTNTAGTGGAAGAGGVATGGVSAGGGCTQAGGTDTDRGPRRPHTHGDA